MLYFEPPGLLLVQMQIIGLTGGIGTGKSSACQILRRLYPNLLVIDADVLAHEATEPGKLPYLLLKWLILPQDCFDVSGRLIRSRLAELIFAPTAKGRALKRVVERCIHPWIVLRMVLAIVWAWIGGSGRIVLDIPLLFEAHLQFICTQTVLIDTSDPETQLKRILLRCPQMSETDARNRIASQFPMAVKRKLANQIILNDSSIDNLTRQLKRHFPPPNVWFHRIMYLYFPILLILLSLLAIVYA
jgi:dephospho-CoA kinase